MLAHSDETRCFATAPHLEWSARRDAVPILEGLLLRRSNAAPSLRNQFHRTSAWFRRVACVSARFIGSRFKRLIDLAGAAILLVALSPLMLLVALLIRFHDGGPALFWQIRIGRWGRPFWFPKFRTMVVNAEELKARLVRQNDHGDSVTFKMKRDPRITWIGGIIRKLSIDELPQLWSVLKGDMSLVGPRPPVPNEVARYTLNQRRRLDVVPGLTCLWQIGGRGDLPFVQQVELDIQYIESRSLWMDLRILARTIPAVLLGRGAY